MNLSEARDHVGKAVFFGVISAVATLILSLVGYSNHGFKVGKGSLLDVLLIAGLTWGLSRYSRVCAMLLFAYFLISKIYIGVKSGWSGGSFLSLIFLYYYFQGIRGTCQYQKLNRAE